MTVQVAGADEAYEQRRPDNALAGLPAGRQARLAGV